MRRVIVVLSLGALVAVVACLVWARLGSSGASDTPHETPGESTGAPAGKPLAAAPARAKETARDSTTGISSSSVAASDATQGAARSVVVEGTIRDDQRNPVAGATVTIRGANGPASLRATTDAAGHYEVAGVASGEWTLGVEASPGFLAREKLTVDGGKERVLADVRMPQPCRIDVLAEGLAEGTRLHVTCASTDVDASIAFDMSSSETKDLTLTSGEWEIVAVPTSARTMKRVVYVGEGLHADVVFAFDGRAIRGQVVDAAGAPIAQARVQWGENDYAKSDVQGNFAIDGLGTRADWLFVHAPPDATGRDEFGDWQLKNVTPGGEPIRVVLERQARLRVRIDGLKAGATVPALRVVVDGTTYAWEDFAADAESRVAIPIDAPGHALRVVLWPHEPKSAPLVFDVAPLAAGETRDLGTRAPDPGRAVSLRVLDAEGQPVQDGSVWVTEVWSYKTYKSLDKDGTASFDGMPSGPFFVTVCDGIAGPRHVFAVPEKTPGPVTLRLQEAGTLAVRVLDRSGARVPGVMVNVLAPDGVMGNVLTDVSTTPGQADAQGECSLRVQAGAHRVWLHDFAKGTRMRAGPFTVRSGETTTVEIRMP